MSSTIKRTSQAGSLYRLIYCSRNVIAHTEPVADVEQEIQSILDVARRSNKAANVTGALLFTASGFAQVLEGPRDVVERTFERISADPRHSDVMVLSFTPTERRCFPEWSMGFRGSLKAPDPLAHLLVDPPLAGPMLVSPRATTCCGCSRRWCSGRTSGLPRETSIFGLSPRTAGRTSKSFQPRMTQINANPLNRDSRPREGRHRGHYLPGFA